MVRIVNNKGFAISGILYSILVLFLLILMAILGLLGSRKMVLDKIKKDVFEELNNEKNEVSICESVNDFSFEVGTAYNCYLKDGKARKFFVLGEKNDNVSLIMDRNIGENVVFNSSSTYLESLTKEWNVTVSLPTVSDIALASNASWNECSEKITNIPSWLYTNLNCSINDCNEKSEELPLENTIAYWTSTMYQCARSSSGVLTINLKGALVAKPEPTGAWYIKSGSIDHDGGYGNVPNVGIRPVITISKSKME